MKKLLLLTLLPVFGLLLSNNCFAVKHDYSGIVTAGGIYLPDSTFDSSLNQYVYNFNQVTPSNFYDNSLLFTFPNDYDFASTSVFDSTGYSFLNYVNNGFSITKSGSYCNITRSYSTYDFASNVTKLVSSGNSYTKRIRIATTPYPFDNWIGINDCYKRNAVDSGLVYRYVDGGTYNVSDFNNSSDTYSYMPDWLAFQTPHYTHLFRGSDPLISSTDGLRLEESTYTSSGITYTGNFTPSRLFQNNNMAGFSQLRIPLSSYDGYFSEYRNLYVGRQFEWHFHFDFKGGVTVRPNSSAQIYLNYAIKSSDGQLDNTVSHTRFDCTAVYTNFELDGQVNTTLDITCPLTLADNYISFLPSLVLSSSDGDDLSFFSEYSFYEWSFGATYLVTDNDWTPAESFNNDLHGSLWSIYNGNENIAQDSDFLDSLTRLFSFGLPVENTPLGLILGGFSDQTNCASIPTIAGMINSNETQVCPFFPASVRSITTPVLGLFSVCLVFGAFMSWLGGSSGNFIEDSSTHSWGGFKIAKGGKK